MTRFALPMRLARREVRRRPGRTALVALLVALPVAAMVLAAVLIRTDFVGPDGQWVRYNGQADLRTQSDLEPQALDLPAGSRQVEIRGSFLTVTSEDVVGATADGDDRQRVMLEVSDAPLLDPITSGMFDLLDGRSPAAAGEIVMSPRVLDRLDAEIGDEIEISSVGRLAIVGTVEQPSCLACDTAIVAPGSLSLAQGWMDNGVRVLVDLPDSVTGAELQQMVDEGDGLVSARGIPEPFESTDDGTTGVRWAYVLGAVALTVAGIVISAAFAVGARRQLVSIGQLSASGASPATIRSSLVLQGTFTGIVGAVAGFVLAAVVLVVGEGRIETFLGHRIDGYVVRPFELLVVALIGVVAATVAALLPARTAAQIPTLAALAGRRPVAGVSRRLVVGGFAAVAAGLALLGLAVLGSTSGSSGDVWALVAIAGGVLQLLGACAIAPAVVARLEPLAGRVRGSWRLAARSLARHRSRTGAVVSAVAAACALAVAATSLVLGADAQDPGYLTVADDVIVARQATDEIHVSEDESFTEYLTNHEPVTEGVRTELERILPDARITELRTASVDPAHPGLEEAGGGMWIRAVDVEGAGGDGDWVQYGYGMADAIVADDAVLDAIHATDEVRAALDEHGVVMLDREVSGTVVLQAPGGIELPGVAAGNRYTLGYVSPLLLTEAAARAAELDVATTGTVLQSDDALTADQRRELEDLQDDLGWVPGSGMAEESTSYLNLSWHEPDGGPSPFQLELLLSGVALVLALFVVGVSLALAAAESKDERDVLTIAGAPPRALARSAGARAALLAGLGAAMAVPIGFLPVVVFTRAESDGFPLVFPVRTVLLLLLVAPIVVSLVSYASSAAAQRLRPVRVSTATFE